MNEEIKITNKSEKGKIFEAEYRGAKITRKTDGKYRERPFYVWFGGEVLRSKRAPNKSAKTRMFGSVESAAKAIDAEIEK